LREAFFGEPSRSLGGNPIPLVAQAVDTAWAEFVENVRWSHARIVFATVHLVGSRNGMDDFRGRTAWAGGHPEKTEKLSKAIKTMG